MKRVPNKSGDRYNSLVLVALSYEDDARGRKWRVRCDCGAEKAVYVQKVKDGRQKTCGDRSIHPAPRAFGTDHPQWREHPSYRTVHGRLRRERGRAADHSCVDCGNPAGDWSYAGGCPNEVASPTGPYSPDLDRYEPRCKSCHNTHDDRTRNFGGVTRWTKRETRAA